MVSAGDIFLFQKAVHRIHILDSGFVEVDSGEIRKNFSHIAGALQIINKETKNRFPANRRKEGCEINFEKISSGISYMLFCVISIGSPLNAGEYVIIDMDFS
jgi:hypothetical protein